MDSDRCPCGNFRRKPGRGCNCCDLVTPEEKAADKKERDRENKEARASSVQRILGFWKNGSVDFVDPTTVQIGDYQFGFHPDRTGWFGDISSTDHPELQVMINDLLERFKGRLTKELYV